MRLSTPTGTLHQLVYFINCIAMVQLVYRLQQPEWPSTRNALESVNTRMRLMDATVCCYAATRFMASTCATSIRIQTMIASISNDLTQPYLVCIYALISRFSLPKWGYGIPKCGHGIQNEARVYHSLVPSEQSIHFTAITGNPFGSLTGLAINIPAWVPYKRKAISAKTHSGADGEDRLKE